MHGDRTREPTELGLVHDDHPTRSGRRSIERVRSEPALGIRQASVDVLELAASQQLAGKDVAEHRPAAEQLIGERREPAQQRGLVSASAERGRRQLDQVRGPGKVVGCQGVAYRLGRFAVALVPRTRPPMQLRHVFGLLVQQARAQHVGEEVVIPVPVAAIQCAADIAPERGGVVVCLVK
jgi:hypothetical protein